MLVVLRLLAQYIFSECVSFDASEGSNLKLKVFCMGQVFILKSAAKMSKELI